MVKMTGGDKIGAALAKYADKVTRASEVQVGFFSDATYPDGTIVAQIAAIQEYGAPRKGIPPRPFFRNMIAKNSPEWPKLIAETLKATNFDATRTLDLVGGSVEADLKQSIIETDSPPLSPVTVMLRGMRTVAKYRNMPFWERFAIAKQRVADGKTNYGASSTPLRDTQVMIKAISHEVK